MIHFYIIIAILERLLERRLQDERHRVLRNSTIVSIICRRQTLYNRSIYIINVINYTKGIFKHASKKVILKINLINKYTY